MERGLKSGWQKGREISTGIVIEIGVATRGQRKIGEETLSKAIGTVIQLDLEANRR